MGTKPAGFRRWKTLGIVAFFLVVFLVNVGSLVILGKRSASQQNRAALSKRHHVGPIARLDELHGNGRIFLVQIGEHKTPYSIDDFARWLRTKYALDMQVLPAITPVRAAWNSSRHQYVAELLYDQIKREHPDLAAEPNAYLIGFTDAGASRGPNRHCPDPRGHCV
jgi:hypothetical protein